MSTDETWVTADQYRGIEVGLRIVRAWAGADEEPEAELHAVLQREHDPADIVIGLATVARLLALELATATGTSETAVFERLDATVAGLQHPISQQ